MTTDPIHDQEREYLLGDDMEPDYDAEPVDLDPAEAAAFDRANWHLRSIAKLRAQREALVANFQAEVARLQIRANDRVARLDREIAWHEQPLMNLHAAIRSADDTRATITLACGTLRSKRGQATWEYPDEEAFILWAREHYPELLVPRQLVITAPDDVELLADLVEKITALLPDDVSPDAVRLSPSTVAKAEVKRVLRRMDAKGKRVLVAGIDPATGEAPPGLTVTEGRVEYTVDTDTDELAE